MQFTLSRTPLLLLLALGLTVQGCAAKERLVISYPPFADVKAAIEPKPVASVDIVTSDQAAADYSLALELWGDRISAASGRICRWVIDTGGKLPFDCPKAVK